MSNSTESLEYEFGEYVEDRVSVRDPDTDAGMMVIVRVYKDTPPDEFVIDDASGKSLHDSVDDWPMRSDENYDPSDDFVVDTVYMEDLDRKFGGEWLKWGQDEFIRLCERNDVTIYSYHASRLSEATPMTFPK